MSRKDGGIDLSVIIIFIWVMVIITIIGDRLRAQGARLDALEKAIKVEAPAK